MKDTFFVLAIFGGVVMGLALLIVMELYVDNFAVWTRFSVPIGSVFSLGQTLYSLLCVRW